MEEVTKQLVNLRCQVCPRTSYSTGGLAATTLLRVSLTQDAEDLVKANNSSSSSFIDQSAPEQELKDCVLRTHEFEFVRDQQRLLSLTHSQSLEDDSDEAWREVNGHCILFHALSGWSVEKDWFSMEDEEEQQQDEEAVIRKVEAERERAVTIAKKVHLLLSLVFKNKRSKLVFFVIPVSSSVLQQEIREVLLKIAEEHHLAQDTLVVQDVLWMCSLYVPLASKKRRYEEDDDGNHVDLKELSAEERQRRRKDRVLQASMNPLLGFNNQPSVQSRCQFRFLWSMIPQGSSLTIQSDYERQDIEQAKQRVLFRISKHNLKDGNQWTWQAWDHAIGKILADGGDDYDVYDYVRKQTLGTSIEEALFETQRNTSVNTKVNSSGVGGADEGGADGPGRNEYMAKNIKECFPTQTPKVRSLLDYGCAEGAITSVLGKAFEVPPGELYGADVRAIPSEGFRFVQISAEDIPSERSPALGTILPEMTDNKIQLITASMVFHHVTYIEATILELHRVISKTDGVLILREHDCNSRGTAIFLDVVHGLYSLSWTDPVESPEFLDEYRAFYRSKEEWDQIMQEYGFQPVLRRNEKQNFHYMSGDRSKLKADGHITNVVRGYNAVYLPIKELKKMRSTNMKDQPTSTLEQLKANHKSVIEHDEFMKMAAKRPRIEQKHFAQQQQLPQQLKPGVPMDSFKGNPEDVTILESRTQPGKIYRFYRRTGKREWIL